MPAAAIKVQLTTIVRRLDAQGTTYGVQAPIEALLLNEQLAISPVPVGRIPVAQTSYSPTLIRGIESQR